MGSSGFSKNKNTRAGARFALRAVLALGLSACGGTVVEEAVVEEEAVEVGRELSSLGSRGPRVPPRVPRVGGRQLGDYNGDGGDDFLCHDAKSGYKWIDYANDYGQFHGTDWERDAGWCGHDTGRLHKGDFNGDGRDDWLCHDTATGYKWIDYADVNGQFHGTDWERAASWCAMTSTQLFIGDFNGDNRDDWLCHDVLTGYKWIDYADVNGEFHGEDWYRDAHWCGHRQGRFLVGDFNGDNRDDWLCHDVASGYKWLDYADGNGQFHGTDWERDAGWCMHDTAEFHIGDFNGDGRDDWLCHDVAGAYKRADYADSFGVFHGTDWYGYVNWCTHTGAQLH